MKQYIINEDDLRDLLHSYYLLSALEYGGVDNWDWYSESIEDYLDFVFNGQDVKYKRRAEYFNHLIEDELKKYCELPKNWQSPEGE